MLGAFYHFSVDLHKIRALQGLETKIIVAKVAVIDDRLIEFSGIFFNYFPGFL